MIRPAPAAAGKVPKAPPAAAAPAAERAEAATAATVASATESVLCSRCEAVCCRLTVVLMPEDRVPHWLVAEDDHGPDTMAKGDDGWCVALDRNTMQCSIYEQRPTICRKFAMGGPYCRDERDEYAAAATRATGIPFVWR